MKTATCIRQDVLFKNVNGIGATIIISVGDTIEIYNEHPTLKGYVLCTYKNTEFYRSTLHLKGHYKDPVELKELS